ncbi:MAG: glycoside hydrolase family 3 N-terminal domain-containing protein [Bacteroidota bacterium]|nr:glycoside hydrolase family 3 N-terminal domain-containing protein [Bacteroidota bacterium]
MKYFMLAILCWVTFLLAADKKSSATEQKIDSILATMTIEEKIGQMTQTTGQWNWHDPANYTSNSAASDGQRIAIREGRIGSFLNVYGSTITRELQTIAVTQSRTKIPLIFGFDVIHGFRTTFPIPLAEACSWDLDAIEQSARIAAREATAAGLHWTFAPMVDIARDPRWGRIMEGAGEDPFYGSLVAASRVKGFQGNDLSSNNTMASCIKHFAAYGGAEGGRDYNTVDISHRTLLETYLPPYKAGINAGAVTVMTSFNEINGIPSTGNKNLLTDILRNEWKFDGFVVSDWGAVGELRTHGFASSESQAAKKALLAGTDMDMESFIYEHQLSALVKSGEVNEQYLDQSVRRILRVKYLLGLFDDPFRYCDSVREKNELLNPNNVIAAREIAKKSIVLLKNEKNLLPLSKKIKSIAVVGPLADDKANPLGFWNALGDPTKVTTVLEGIRKTVSSSTKIIYAKGCEIDSLDTSGFKKAVETAKRSDVVIAVVGESAVMSGESKCRSSLNLPGVQEEFIKALLSTGKPVIVVLMNGRPLTIEYIDSHVPAILETWFLGMEAGNAIADVLFGDYNPSGKLVTTFPRTVGQIPIHYNHKNSGRPSNPDPKSYSVRYLDLPITPLYPFGYGLSYTQFTYGKPSLNSHSITTTDSIMVSVDVKNSGSRAGEEVVQLYIRDEFGSVTRPVKELKGFKKIFLNPDETKRVDFIVTPELLSMYDIDMHYGVESGTFKVYVGTNSSDVQEASFEVVE